MIHIYLLNCCLTFITPQEDKYDPNAVAHVQKSDQVYDDGDDIASTHGIGTGIEMQKHPKSSKDVEIQEDEVDEDYQGSSKRHSFGEGLKRRLGSLRRKKE